MILCVEVRLDQEALRKSRRDRHRGSTESEVRLVMLIGHLADGYAAMPRPGGRQLVHSDARHVINHDSEHPVRTQDDLPQRNGRWWEARIDGEDFV
jgi:hypothetical protein